ncbi:MAG TPA: hypothetical protein DFR83_14870, partial [Deltaproteobacteria bacterium]|nr:hypothetical protein [Deltaproteobacteria bacterium]
PTDRRVVVDEAQRADLRAAWVEETGRQPSEPELHEQIGQWVTQEVRVREAQRLGLDRADPIIRARLAEKMAFVATATQPDVMPTEAELRALFAEHKDRYRTPTRITLRQVFTGPDPAAAEHVRLAWSAGADPRELAKLDAPGGPVLRGRTPERLTERYGVAFSDQVEGLEPGAPTIVESTLGWHVVAIQTIDRGGERTFEDVRERVALQWRAIRRRTVTAEADARLLESYEVVGWSP